jgi:Mg2+ and Co2+ transporter CorA
MVLVFGVNVPLIELNLALAVINIILMIEVTIVLIIIMYQLRALRRLKYK